MQTITHHRSNHGNASAGPAPRGHHARRVLAVRALAAQLDWLIQGVPCWIGNRVAWRLPNGGVLCPTVNDLARAQQHLYKTRQYPFASQAVFADPVSWRETMQERLALAGRLRQLSGSDADFRDANRLIDLLPAEALCASGEVPGPPSHTLVSLAAAGAISDDTLARLANQVSDSEWSLSARTLAGMTLGALQRQIARQQSFAWGQEGESCIRDAFLLGLRDGLPPQAPLIAALIAVADSRLVARGKRLCYLLAQTRTTDVPLPFPAPIDSLRETVLQRGDRVAEKTEELIVVSERLLERGHDVSLRLLAWRHEVTTAESFRKNRRPPDYIRRRDEAKALRASRSEAAQPVAVLFEKLLRQASGKTDLVALVDQILNLAETLLTLHPASTLVLQILEDTLASALRLPPDQLLDFFTLASAENGAVWRLPQHLDRPAEDGPFSDWRRNQWRTESGRLRKLLQVTKDADLIREILQLGVYEEAASQIKHDGGDTDHLRLMVRLLCSFRPERPKTKHCPFVHAIQRMLCVFPHGKEAQAAFQPLLCVMETINREADHCEGIQRVLSQWLFAVPEERAERYRTPTRLARIALRFLRYAEAQDKETWENDGGTLARLAVWMSAEMPDTFPVLFDRLLTVISDLPPSNNLTVAVQITSLLSGGDPDRFAALLPGALQHLKINHGAGGYEDSIEKGLATLKRYPNITPPLTALCTTQPKRTIELLQKIGRATHLGNDVTAPLTECRFESSETADSDDPEWQQLLVLGPEMPPLVASLWQATWQLGLPANVPPGISRLLHENERRAAELDYLETLCETKSPSEAPSLFARRDNLRERCQNSVLRADTLTEIRDRLSHAVSETQMTVLERQAEACFRERLCQTVGNLPDSLVLTPDLENAVLLSFTIRKNRKPLLKLLRAVVFGEPDPFAYHPKNIEFRQSLTDRGVDVSVWRGTNAKPVSIPASETVPAKSLHLFLENDPLAVLQMGNYFGTCLSVAGGFNAFSTVANAVEQNKRVLFARDSAGTVIARKLIGINTDGALVGFYTYCTLSEAEAATGVRAAITEYLKDFAGRCRLPLADEGTIPTLFAEDWYDDGVVSWAEESVSEGEPVAQAQPEGKREKQTPGTTRVPGAAKEQEGKRSVNGKRQPL